MSELTDHSPIAIGGCGSSGTNLLRRILDTHSQIACGKEMSVFDRPAVYNLSLEALYKMYKTQDFHVLDASMPFRIQLDNNQTYFGLRRGNHGDTYHDVPTTLAIFARADNTTDFWHKYFSLAAQRDGKHVWAEKTPGNIFCVKHFFEMYPAGRFIHMIRDGRDVCLSLIDRRNFAPATAMMRWTASIEAGLEVRGDDRVYEVRYEELVHDPESVLQPMFEWLGVEYEPTVLDYHKKENNNRYGYASDPIHRNSVGRWERHRDEMTPGMRRTMQITLRRHLNLTGYPMKEDTV